MRGGIGVFGVRCSVFGENSGSGGSKVSPPPVVMNAKESRTPKPEHRTPCVASEGGSV